MLPTMASWGRAGGFQGLVYELREAGAIVSTGRLTIRDVPKVDQRIPLTGRLARVVEVTVRGGETLIVLEGVDGE